MKQAFTTFIFLVSLSVCSLGQPYSIGEQTILYTDSLRNRPVKVEVWYPTAEADAARERKTDLPFVLDPTIRNARIVARRFPLVVLSHGTGGNRFGLAWLAISLAKRGYIVAAPDHWGNTFDNKVPAYFVRYWERPQDISFLLTQLLQEPLFHQAIDKERIGMVGFSFGGYTSLALAGADINCSLLKAASKTPQGKKEFTIPELGDLRKLIDRLPCESVPPSFRDSRIKGFVALAPALGLGFGSLEQTEHIKAPVLIIGSESDRVAPVKTNAIHYSKLIPSSRYLELEGKAGHYVFLNVGDAGLRKEARTYYRDDESINRASIHKKVEEEIAAFLRDSLK